MENKKIISIIVIFLSCIILVSGYTADNYNDIQSTLRNDYTSDNYENIISIFGSDEITSVCSGNENCIIQCSGNWNITDVINMNRYIVLMNGTGNIYNFKNIINASEIRIQGGCIANG